MPLPPLYKFMDVRGAKLTLGNRSFRHAKPSDFNDTEDMTVQSLFPEPLEEALEKLVAGFEEVILNHINDVPTCDHPLNELIQWIQQCYRDHPQIIGVFQNDAADVYNLDAMRARSEDYLGWINKFMQEHRVLCVTTERSSEKLWREYAGNYSGIALRIEGNVTKDSKFQLFEPVSYFERRPPLYADTLQFASDSLFGNLEARAREMTHKIIYSKTLQWKDECEYRLAIPLGENEEPYETLSFHREEITELYLGEKMKMSDIAEIVVMARRLNPRVSVLQCERDGKGNMVFRRS